MLVANNEDILKLFEFQWSNSPIYKKWCAGLGINNIGDVKTVEEIPFIPIELFRNHDIYIGEEKPQLIFSSSGTTQNETSKHFVVYEIGRASCRERV